MNKPQSILPFKTLEEESEYIDITEIVEQSRKEYQEGKKLPIENLLLNNIV